MRTWWPYLDLARFIAAFMVVLSHLRGFVFVDFNQFDHSSLAWSAFYFATGFGHQAVMIFFVLSGFLVGGAVVSRAAEARWSWTDYAILRMTRLWTVLVPALVLTALWDQIGMALTGSPFYAGTMGAVYNSGGSLDPLRYGAAAFFGNLAFLQTIAVPSFGTNGPLWSLANEFWYYLLFPLIFGALFAKARLGTKFLNATLALIICYLLPIDIVILGAIWLFGVAAFVTHRKVRLSRLARNILLGCSAARRFCWRGRWHGAGRRPARSPILRSVPHSRFWWCRSVSSADRCRWWRIFRAPGPSFLTLSTSCISRSRRFLPVTFSRISGSCRARPALWYSPRCWQQ